MRSRLSKRIPTTVAAKIAADKGVASVAKVKLLIAGGLLVFGLDPSEFAYRRLVVTAGARGEAMAGDHSRKHLGETLELGAHGPKGLAVFVVRE